MEREPDGRPKKKIKNMSTADQVRKQSYRWAAKLFGLTFVISVTLSFISERMLSSLGYIVSFLVLLTFIAFGIIFDIIGVAVTSAEERPFHSMASHKAHGAIESLMLLRNAEKVSSFCNDVVGDVCGIISGATGAVIVVSLVRDFSMHGTVTSLLVSGVVAALTVGGKAFGKGFAMRYNTRIVFAAGRILHFFRYRGEAGKNGKGQ